MMFPKKQRIVDPTLREAVKAKPCVVCYSRNNVDPDHITSRGAGGEDTKRNLWPLCRQHHSDRHQAGIKTFVKKYYRARAWLEAHRREDILEGI